MKGNFWRKIFRKGYNAHGYHSAQYNGTMSKQDARSSRVRINRLMDEISPKIVQEGDELVITIDKTSLPGPYTYYFNKEDMMNDKETPEDMKRYIEILSTNYFKGHEDDYKKNITVEDIERIITIENDMIEQFDRTMLDQMSDEEYYTEMLRRFYEE